MTINFDPHEITLLRHMVADFRSRIRGRLSSTDSNTARVAMRFTDEQLAGIEMKLGEPADGR